MTLNLFLTRIPHAIVRSLLNYRILSADFGQLKTMLSRECVDKDNAPIPWYSYPAVEYIKQLDFSDANVFEFGSGNSTIFWGQRCKRLISVEDNDEWYHRIKPRLPTHVEYRLCRDAQAYVNSIVTYPEKFDLIIIDGSHRWDCAARALDRLNESGMIILDNSDWHQRTSARLRAADLIEVDMSGFGPINGYTWTTSFYLRRNVRLKPLLDTQPVHGVGSLDFSEL